MPQFEIVTKLEFLEDTLEYIVGMKVRGVLGLEDCIEELKAAAPDTDKMKAVLEKHNKAKWAIMLCDMCKKDSRSKIIYKQGPKEKQNILSEDTVDICKVCFEEMAEALKEKEKPQLVETRIPDEEDPDCGKCKKCGEESFFASNMACPHCCPHEEIEMEVDLLRWDGIHGICKRCGKDDIINNEIAENYTGIKK